MVQAEQFYRKAAERTSDADIRRLLGDLAAIEARHGKLAESLNVEHLKGEARDEEDRAAHRQFILTWVQPGHLLVLDRRRKRKFCLDVWDRKIINDRGCSPRSCRVTDGI